MEGKPLQNPLKKIGEWVADAFIEKASAPLNEMKEELSRMSKRLDGLEKLHEQDEAALEADLSMMDDRICYLIGMCRQRGYTTSDERRRITRLHDAYRARGGNHGEENEYARFLALPTEEEYNRMKGE